MRNEDRRTFEWLLCRLISSCMISFYIARRKLKMDSSMFHMKHIPMSIKNIKRNIGALPNFVRPFHHYSLRTRVYVSRETW